MEQQATARPAQIVARLEAIRYAAERIHLLELRRPDGQPLPAFEPGAHIDLHLGNGLVRQYSIASSPGDLSRYRIAVKRDPASRGGSSWIFDSARVGQQILIGAPRNLFALVDQAPFSLLVAGGIGITPIVCMVDRLAATGRDWHLAYSVRRRAEAAFADHLLSRYADRVTLHVDEEHDGRLLDIDALICELPPSAHVYCCGPAPMLEAFEKATAGIAPDRVHIERFSAPQPSASAGGFVVELARSGQRIPVLPGQTIAESVRAAGVGVTVSCQQGICGTCETRVLAGIPDHRDALLSDAEKAANDVMMICCSGSRTPVLVLDL